MRSVGPGWLVTGWEGSLRLRNIDPAYSLASVWIPGTSGTARILYPESTYTTCPVGNDDWKLKVDDLNIDQSLQTGTARNVLLSFKDMPLLYSPWADFPLNDARKSGFLAPTIGYSGSSGLDLRWRGAPYRL